MISEIMKSNFDVLKDAVKNNDLCLKEYHDSKDRKKVNLICAVDKKDDKNKIFTPIAIMIEKNPTKRYTSIKSPSKRFQ